MFTHLPLEMPSVIKEKDDIIKAAHDHITTVFLNQPSAEQVFQSLEACRIAHFAWHRGIPAETQPYHEQERWAYKNIV
jgi:hypothetical protein